MNIIQSVHPEDFKKYDTATIRQRFLLDGLAKAGEINVAYTHYDRMMVGLAQPGDNPVELGTYAILRSDYFLERREMGIINVGGSGKIIADEVEYELNKLDCLYLGKGIKSVIFSGNGEQQPVFYLLSAPAHASCPPTLLKKEDAAGGEMGSADTANRRTIYRYIHKEGIQSCQLVMGLTILATGSVWNTIPPHTHDRRMEVYFYFDLPEGQRVFHYMGEPQETRHILVNNHGAVVSPPWSIHAGSGTSSYSFIWGMAGENIVYTDMDAVAVEDLR